MCGPACCVHAYIIVSTWFILEEDSLRIKFHAKYGLLALQTENVQKKLKLLNNNKLSVNG